MLACTKSNTICANFSAGISARIAPSETSSSGLADERRLTIVFPSIGLPSRCGFPRRSEGPGLPCGWRVRPRAPAVNGRKRFKKLDDNFSCTADRFGVNSKDVDSLSPDGPGNAADLDLTQVVTSEYFGEVAEWLKATVC